MCLKYPDPYAECRVSTPAFFCLLPNAVSTSGHSIQSAFGQMPLINGERPSGLLDRTVLLSWHGAYHVFATNCIHCRQGLTSALSTILRLLFAEFVPSRIDAQVDPFGERNSLLLPRAAGIFSGSTEDPVLQTTGKLYQDPTAQPHCAVSNCLMSAANETPIFQSTTYVIDIHKEQWL